MVSLSIAIWTYIINDTIASFLAGFLLPAGILIMINAAIYSELDNR
jgi:hypothetical protein